MKNNRKWYQNNSNFVKFVKKSLPFWNAGGFWFGCHRINLVLSQISLFILFYFYTFFIHLWSKWIRMDNFFAMYISTFWIENFSKYIFPSTPDWFKDYKLKMDDQYWIVWKIIKIIAKLLLNKKIFELNQLNYKNKDNIDHHSKLLSHIHIHICLIVILIKTKTSKQLIGLN